MLKVVGKGMSCIRLEERATGECLRGGFENVVKSLKINGFFPPTAYYLNHDVNVEYVKSEKNGGVLDFPMLFIDGKYDAVCSTTTTPKMAEI